MTQVRMFVSAAGGVGKTAALLNTARHLARMGQRVLCVDADPMRGLVRAAGLHPRDAGEGIRLPVEESSLWVEAGEPSAVDGADFDWVLVDAPPRWPIGARRMPEACLVLCTDASELSLALFGDFLEELDALRERHPGFSLHRVLLTRVDAASPVQWDFAASLRGLGPGRVQETVIWQDAAFTAAARLPLFAAPGTLLYRQTARLALEWLEETDGRRERHERNH